LSVVPDAGYADLPQDYELLELIEVDATNIPIADSLDEALAVQSGTLFGIPPAEPE
jgi:hypothetical protein